MSERVRITPAECVLGVTHPNGECCQNLVSNTINVYSLLH